MKETVKKLVCMIAVITIAFAVPGVAKAEDIYEEETPAGNVVDSDLRYGDIFVTLFTGEWSHVDYIQYTVGDYLNLSYPANERFVYLFDLNILSYLTEEQKYLITNSLNTTLIAEVSIEYFSDPGYSSTSFLPRFSSILNGGSEYQVNFSETQAQPVKGTYELNYGDYFYGTNIDRLKFLGYSYFNGYGDKLVDMQYLIESLKLTIKTEGVDKSTADIVVNLGKIEDSINQGFDNIGNQIGDVQEDINSGFDEVGGKLDGIQSDINTGLDNVTGAINGAGADTSGMDNGMAQLGGQLGDLGDVEDQLGGLIMDKVEVPDLILTNDQGSALALLVSCLNLAYVDLKDYQVMFASVMFFGIIGVLLFGRRNL